MRNLDAFPNIGEHRRMFADDIARADGSKTNRAGNTFTGVPFTGVDRAVFQIFIQCMSNRFPIASAVPDGASTL